MTLLNKAQPGPMAFQRKVVWIIGASQVSSHFCLHYRTDQQKSVCPISRSTATIAGQHLLIS